MKLNDVRKFAIRKRSPIRFPVLGGLECRIGDDGVSRVAGLDAPPQFDLEQEFGKAVQFTVETAAGARQRAKDAGAQRTVSRQELEEMVRTGTGSAQLVDHDHEE